MHGSNGDTDIENRIMDTVGEGEGGANGESSRETYKLPCVKHIGSGNLLYGARCSNQVLRDNLEAWGGVGDAEGFERGELYVYLWLIHVDVWQKPRQFCKAIILKLKSFLKDPNFQLQNKCHRYETRVQETESKVM